MTWYVDNNGCRWRLCEIIRKFAGTVTVRLYDHITGQFTGQELTGHARAIVDQERRQIGALVEAK